MNIRKSAMVDNKQNQTTTKKCAKLFAGAGAGAALVNVFVNDGIDCFQKAGKEAVVKGCKYSTGIIVKAGTIGVLTLGVAAASATVGAIIGKCIDKISQARASKEKNTSNPV